MARTTTVEKAAALRDEILAVHQVTESERRLPQTIVEVLTEAGLYRMLLPEAHGGSGVTLVEALQVWEELARAEAAVAWCVWNSALPILFSRHLGDAVRTEIFGHPGGRYASSSRATGRAVAENGHYRISGRWSLVSGCLHADWVALMCTVEEDGEPRMVTEEIPEMRLAFLPMDRTRILDTWRSGGLRGTGSHDVVVDDVPVAAERTLTPMDPPQIDGPLGWVPVACVMSLGHGAMCLGIAQAALDALVDLARTKVTVDPVKRLPDRGANQALVAESATLLAALRVRLQEVAEAMWGEAGRGPVSPTVIADGWATAVTAGRTSRRIVDGVYEAAGSPALYRDHVIDRCHRDIHAAMQHVVAQRFWLEEAGRVTFGMEPENVLFAL